MNFREIRQNIGLIFLPAIVRVLCTTLKFNVVFENKNIDISNCVFLFWHGTMTGPWYFNRNKNFSAVVSTSKDGEILCRVLKNWNYELIRGSSSNSDKQEVMKKIEQSLLAGKNIAITPDGPRGERLKMKIGGLIAAVRTQKNILLCGSAFKKKVIFNSWDKFEFPLPFTKCSLVISGPYNYDANLTKETYENIRLDLENELNRLQNKAGELL